MQRLVFEDEEIWERFKTELISWYKTPYRWLSYSKGKGSDCTGYIFQSLLNCGFVSSFHYLNECSTDWYLKETNVIYDLFWRTFKDYTTEGYQWKYLHDCNDYFQGDILLFRIYRKVNSLTHSTVLLDNEHMTHCANGKYVTQSYFDYRWKSKCAGIFRLCFEKKV